MILNKSKDMFLTQGTFKEQYSKIALKLYSDIIKMIEENK
jgi:hypothetical protein